MSAISLQIRIWGLPYKRDSLQNLNYDMNIIFISVKEKNYLIIQADSYVSLVKTKF